LLPLRIVMDRNRGGAYVAVSLTFIAAFGLFLFLTYFLQQIRGFSPVMTGVAFLPLPFDLVLGSAVANIVLLPRFGSRRLIVAGLLLGLIGMALLTRLGPHSGYGLSVLPSLVILGIGFGLVVPPALNSATSGVDVKDAGVASAMVNTTQQVGGSIGVALLSAFAAQATRRYLTAHAHASPHSDLANLAATHGYTFAFTISAAIFLAAAVICGGLIRKHPPQTSRSVAAVTPRPANSIPSR
jgi:predicted MFS family arabinose efflux permease